MSDIEVRQEDADFTPEVFTRVPGLPELEDIEDGERTYWAHRLRLTGLPWNEIAARVGFSGGVVANVEVRRYLQKEALELSSQRRAEALELELMRLDDLQSVYYPQALVGEIKAAEFVLKVMSQRSKLLGLEQGDTKDSGSRTLIITPENYKEELKRLVEGEVVDEGEDDE